MIHVWIILDIIYPKKSDGFIKLILNPIISNLKVIGLGFVQFF